MIGNDVVDLKVAALESNWMRLGFLDKVFSEEEQEVILNSENKSQMVWLFWSMKEAAYKIYMQQFGVRIFNPKKMRCERHTENKGLVHFNGYKYATKSEITNDFINTWAYLETSVNALIHCFKITDSSYINQSLAAKQKLLKSFSEIKKVSETDLEIKSSKNSIPRLFYKGYEQRDSFSIAHHGFYVACAISFLSPILKFNTHPLC
jgi:phosphopantetheinyl transferase (holo-ACP synthase)|tara:strand:+ start:65 stop:682 length:618 start_codon:yes stop_codon:yes gene_type:complete